MEMQFSFCQLRSELFDDTYTNFKFERANTIELQAQFSGAGINRSLGMFLPRALM